MLALIAGLRKRGLRVAPFKKGPDFIDPAWISVLADQPCYNLDPYLMDESTILAMLNRHSAMADIVLVEGNHGIFDGVDEKGSVSSARLAKILRAPVILVLDCQGMSATAAAVVLGIQQFDPDCTIAGVILNRLAGERHERVVTAAIRDRTTVPIVGAIHRRDDAPLEERHLGLLPPCESGRQASVERVSDVMSEALDVEQICRIAESAPPLDFSPQTGKSRAIHTEPVRIGLIRDDAFQFYYQDNLDALREHGADLVELSAIHTEKLPSLDLLYIGGGFPERHAERLANNRELMAEIRTAERRGMPIYAECGGALYLGRSIAYEGRHFELVGIFPIDYAFRNRPYGHGYLRGRVVAENPFYSIGTELVGHEFHYSRPSAWEESQLTLVCQLSKGYGFDGARDGLCQNRTFAAYCHVHVAGMPTWPTALVTAAAVYRRERCG